MCLTAYNLQSSVEGAKASLEEAMGEAFDAKELLGDGTYMDLCDNLKVRYEWCAEFIEHLNLPIGTGLGTRVCFSNWGQEDQLEIKKRISEINETISHLITCVRMLQLEEEPGLPYKALIALWTEPIQAAAEEVRSYIRYGRQESVRDDETIVLRFEFEGISYLRDADNVLYQSEDGETDFEVVGRYDPNEEVIDFNYNSD